MVQFFSGSGLSARGPKRACGPTLPCEISLVLDIGRSAEMEWQGAKNTSILLKHKELQLLKIIKNKHSIIHNYEIELQLLKIIKNKHSIIHNYER